MSRYRCVWAATFGLLVGSAHANTGAGREWLESQGGNAGEIAAEGIATPYQATAEALLAIESTTLADAALDFLSSYSHHDSESIARRILALANWGRPTDVATTQLRKLQNSDGGFGGGDGFTSTIVDTAWALTALNHSDSSASASRAVQFLVDQQAWDGGWMPEAELEPRLIGSALAAQALWSQRHQFEVETQLQGANQFLMDHLESDALWSSGSVYVSARVLMVLLKLNIDRAELAESLTALAEQQTQDGSFRQDVYVTALAVRALNMGLLQHPDISTVQGRITDTETGLPLANVQLAPAQPGYDAVTTGEDGAFLFEDVASGEFALQLTRYGYLGIDIHTEVEVGEHFDFGELRLRLDPAAGQGSIRGTVTDQLSGAAIPGSVVELTGAGVAHTDSQGNYQFAGVRPGRTSVSITAQGYAGHLAEVDIPVKGVGIYSAELSSTPPPESGTVLTGRVVDRDTGAPIEGAMIQLSGAGSASETTDEAGFYELAISGVGRLYVRVTASGYDEAQSVFDAPETSRHSYSPSLLPEGAGPSGSVIVGRVVDAGSGEALAGVSVIALSAHKYWRMHVTDAGTYHDRLVLSELQLRDVPGGASIAVGGQPFSSPWDPSNAIPQNAFDGQDLPNWRSNGYLPAFIGYRFSEPVRIVEYVVQNHLHSSSPITWELQYSHDGVVWNVADSKSGNVYSDFESRRYSVLGKQVHAVSDAQGRFELVGMLGPQIDLQFVDVAYETGRVTLNTTPTDLMEVGTVQLVPSDRRYIQPDLVVDTLDIRSQVETDLQALSSQGQARFTVRNTGSASANGFRASVFLDRDNDHSLSPGVDSVLGEIAIEQTVAPGEAVALTVPIAGARTFRDDPLAAYVDSARAVVELNEDNNLRFAAEDCLAVPDIDAFSVRQKWHRSEFSYAVSPVVGPLLDSNGDGAYNASDTPVVLAMGYTGLLPDRKAGQLSAINGQTGATLWSTQTPLMWAGTTPAIGDLDGDGVPEIVAIAQQGGVLALRPDGTLKWQGQAVEFDQFPTNKYGNVSLADLDGDGYSEIIVGAYAFSHQGDLLWHASEASGRSVYSAVPVDLDLDGDLEVVDGNAAFDTAGELLWQNNSVPRSARALVADLIGGPRPEVVLGEWGNVFLLSADGDLIWRRYVPRVTPNGSQYGGGTPAIGDIDGDGKPEIVVAHSTTLTALNSDGQIEWSIESQDGSALISPALFDFDADGALEVAVIDESGLRVVDGRTGQVLYANSDRSTTVTDVPVVADIDGDKHAELLHANHLGIGAYEDISDRWLPATTIWNQHNYHGVNIQPDASIPQRVLPPNSRYASFHSAMVSNPYGVPDATVSRIVVDDRGLAQPLTLTARVGNGGAQPFNGTLPLHFFALDDANQATFLGAVDIAPLAPGEFVDAKLNDVDLPEATVRVRVAVDPAESMAECDELNNVHEAPAAATVALADITLATGAPAYPPGAEATLSAIVTNEGILPAAFELEFMVVDETGQLVASFARHTLDELASQAAIEVDQHWVLPELIAGSYYVQARLYGISNALVAEAELPLNVLSSATLTMALRSTTDQSEYHRTDVLRLHHLVRNLTSNAQLPDVRLRYELRDSGGMLLTSDERSLGEFAPGVVRDVEMVHAFSDWQEGNYLMSALLLNSSNQILATDTAPFTIVARPLADLSADVAVVLAEVPRRDAQTCVDTIHNAGDEVQSDVQLRQLVVNLTDGSIALSEETAATVAAGASVDLQRQFDTRPFSEGSYACAVEAKVDGVWVSLAYAPFTVLPPRIEIDAALQVGDRGRVLVLADRRDKPTDNNLACAHGLARAQFEGEFDPPLSPDATVTVTVADAAGQVLDVETRGVLDGAGEVNANFAGTPVDVSIPSFSTDALLIELTGESLEGTLGEHYALVADIQDHTQTVQWSSGLLDPFCNSLAWTGSHLVNVLEFNGVQAIGSPAANGRFGDGDDQRPASVQISRLANLLQAEGWQSTLVTDAKPFAAALRSGEYDIYLVLAEYSALPRADQKLLREAVFGGAGLLVAGRYDERSRILDEVLGIKYKGTHLNPAGLQLLPSAVHAGGSATFRETEPDDDVQRVRAKGAQVLGTIITDAEPDHPALVTVHAYGEGRAVHVGFDLLAEMSAHGADNLFAELLLGAIAEVDRDQSDVRAGRSVPFALSLQNLGMETPGEVTLSTTAGEWIDATVGSIESLTTLRWPFDLDEDESLSGTVWLQTPFDGNTLSVEAQVESIDGAQRGLRAKPVLSVQPVATPRLSQAIAELEALIAQRQPGPLSGILGLLNPSALDQALAHLRSATAHRDAGRTADAELEILLATDDLIAADTPDVHLVRRYLGTTLQKIGTELSP